MTAFIQTIGHRVIGTVEEVTADRISVLLDPEAPQATALNTGVPAGFPRINGYVLIPNEGGSTACIISSVQIRHLPFPKRRGTQQDFGLVDLPFPSRIITLTPIGTLKSEPKGGELSFRVSRGVDVFPTVGDPVHLPTSEQLRAIVEGEDEAQGRIVIGHCPTAGRAPVHVDPDKLFGRHLAVLGNTGAGKSCSVAGLVRWSLEAAKDARSSAGQGQDPNARFIVLDPNGEYSETFRDLGVRLFRVDTAAEGQPLRVPAWLWNGAEWTAFTDAAPGVQRPVLLQALRRLRGGVHLPDPFDNDIAVALSAYRNILRVAHSSREYLRFPGMKNITIALESAQKDFEDLASEAEYREHAQAERLRRTTTACQLAADAGRDGAYYQAIDSALVEEVLDQIEQTMESLGVSVTDEPSADVPREFDAQALPTWVEALAGLMPGRDVGQFVDTLNLRIRSLLSEERLRSVVQPDDRDPISLERWLTDYVGADQANNGPLAVIDLSLVPSEVIHIVVSVLARMIFEALQRYRRKNHKELPTTLVLEEAHTFVHRELGGESAPPAARECARVFERIAREGRKFGLGLVLASQRPSEVSPTVLSQCNTFLLHRLVNDQDQNLMRRLVPDGLGPLLLELPSLPTRRAILLGWAAPAPILVEVRDLQKEFQPESPDPAFWDVWTGTEKRPIDWATIADAWQRGNESGLSGSEAAVARAAAPARANPVREEDASAPAVEDSDPADLEGRASS